MAYIGYPGSLKPGRARLPVFGGGGGSAPAPVLTSINSNGWNGEVNTAVLPMPAMSTSGAGEFDPENNPKSVTGTRQGYTTTAATTTYPGTWTLTNIVRQTYPNQTSPTSTTAALDEWVYSTDSFTGITNNSAEISPKPMAEWMMIDRLLTGSTIRWEISAFHKDFRNNSQVACVRVRANDGTNQTAWQVVSVPDKSNYCEDARPFETYFGDLALGTVAASGGYYWLEAEVYPWIGAAASVLKSEDGFTAGYTEAYFTRRYFYRSDARFAAPPICYINSTTGSDSTGVWSSTDATAFGLPFLTPKGALDAFNNATRGAQASGGFALGELDGARMRFSDNGATIVSPTVNGNRQKFAALVLERDPRVSRAAASFSMGTAAFTLKANALNALANGEMSVHLEDVTVTRGSASAVFTTANRVSMKNMTLTNNASGKWAAAVDLYAGVIVNGTVGNTTLGTTGGLSHRLTRGMNVVGGGQQIEVGRLLGCIIDNCGQATIPVDATKPQIIFNCVFSNLPGQAAKFYANTYGDTQQIVDLQNVYEYTTTVSSQGGNGHSLDGGLGSIIHAVIGLNATGGYSGGGRSNTHYDENTTVAYRRTHKLTTVFGNISPQFNVKGDVFVATSNGGTPNPTEAPNRIGHFPFHHGVGCFGNISRYRVGSGTTFSEYQKFGGRRSSINLTNNTVPNFTSASIWVNYQGTSDTGTQGAGNGDYHLAASSPALNRVDRFGLRFDNGGALRKTSGLEAAGPYTA